MTDFLQAVNSQVNGVELDGTFVRRFMATLFLRLVIYHKQIADWLPDLFVYCDPLVRGTWNDENENPRPRIEFYFSYLTPEMLAEVYGEKTTFNLRNYAVLNQCPLC